MNKLMNICRKILSSNNFCGNVKISCKLHVSSRFSCQGVANLERQKRIFKGYEEVQKKKLDPYAISLLIIPVASFGLGCWQVHRKKWKEDLIADLKQRREQEPVPLPENFDELKDMEYYPVQVKGKFLYDRELYMGPRSLLIQEGKGNVSYGLAASSSKIGYLVITPFQLSDSGKTILVNRGWISSAQLKDKSYSQVQGNGEIELTGIVRLNEKRPQFGMKNKPESNRWVYRDLYKMAEVANTEPVFLDADASSTVPGGPIGGQTRISLRNEHLSYIITWFGLSIASGGLWYLRFIRTVPGV